MSLKTLVRLAPTVLILSGLAAMRPAAAQFITFGAAQTISGAGDVSTDGTSVAAYNFNNGGATTVNGATFNPTSNTGSGNLSISGADGGSFGGYGSGTSGTAYGNLDSNYQSLITNGIYTDGHTTNGVPTTAGVPTTMSFTESGLTAGHRYQVQYFVDDSRGGFGGRTVNVSSSGGNTQTLNYASDNSTGSLGQYANGIFTAAASAVTMTATGNLNGSTQVNGLQYRDLGNAGAPITFGGVTAIGTAQDTLGNQQGTIISAADFGAGTQTVALANSQVVTFDGTGANAVVVGGNGTTTSAFSGSTGNTNFDTVLNGFNYDSAAGTKQITLSGLTAGKQYSVQLFGLDDRGAQNNRTFSFSDFSGNNSGTITTGLNQYVIGTFTAASAFQTITENLPNNGNINALVVRDLTVSAAPEPSQFACLAFTALGMAGLLLKARKRTASVELS